MQAENSPRVYKNCFQAFGDIYRKEGVSGLYRGVGPTTQRAILLTGLRRFRVLSNVEAAQLSSYDHIKNWFKKIGFHEGILLHFFSATSSGLGKLSPTPNLTSLLVSALITSPVDVVKTRIMNQRTADGQGAMYKGTLDCLAKTIRAEGFFGLYKVRSLG